MTGVAVADICRNAGITQASYFNRKKRHDRLLPAEMQGFEAARGGGRQTQEAGGRSVARQGDAAGRDPPKPTLWRSCGIGKTGKGGRAERATAEALGLLGGTISQRSMRRLRCFVSHRRNHEPGRQPVAREDIVASRPIVCNHWCCRSPSAGGALCRSPAVGLSNWNRGDVRPPCSHTCKPALPPQSSILYGGGRMTIAETRFDLTPAIARQKKRQTSNGAEIWPR